MKYFLDTEFIESGPNEPVYLISIGIVCEDGREFYAELNGVDLSKANDWVKENVIPHLWSQQIDKSKANEWSKAGSTGGLLYRADIARELKYFVGDDPNPEFWAYYADYDWVVFCQIFGTMMDLPKGYVKRIHCDLIPDDENRLPLQGFMHPHEYERVGKFPMFCNDIKQLCNMLGNPTLPEQKGTEHNALEDAKWNFDAYLFLLNYMNTRYDYVGQLEEEIKSKLEFKV